MEIWTNPNKQQINKMLEVYGSPFVFQVTNAVCRALSNPNFNTDLGKHLYRNWYALTRLMILNHSPAKVHIAVMKTTEDLANDDWPNFQLPKEEPREISIDPTATAIKDKIKITEVAEKYGLKVKRSKAVCPFHKDKDPSLSFSNQKGVFNCFGCGVKGDIITFIRLMEDLKNGK